MIVSEALRLEYGCTPAHVTLFTDFNGTEVGGHADVITHGMMASSRSHGMMASPHGARGRKRWRGRKVLVQHEVRVRRDAHARTHTQAEEHLLRQQG